MYCTPPRRNLAIRIYSWSRSNCWWIDRIRYYLPQTVQRTKILKLCIYMSTNSKTLLQIPLESALNLIASPLDCCNLSCKLIVCIEVAWSSHLHLSITHPVNINPPTLIRINFNVNQLRPEHWILKVGRAAAVNHHPSYHSYHHVCCWTQM
jgi:hypothetical protein